MMLKAICALVMTVSLLVVAFFSFLCVSKFYKPEAGVAIVAGCIAFSGALVGLCVLSSGSGRMPNYTMQTDDASRHG